MGFPAWIPVVSHSHHGRERQNCEGPAEPQPRPSRLLSTVPVSWNSCAHARYVLSSGSGPHLCSRVGGRLRSLSSKWVWGHRGGDRAEREGLVVGVGPLHPTPTGFRDSRTALGSGGGWGDSRGVVLDGVRRGLLGRRVLVPLQQRHHASLDLGQAPGTKPTIPPIFRPTRANQSHFRKFWTSAADGRGIKHNLILSRNTNEHKKKENKKKQKMKIKKLVDVMQLGWLGWSKLFKKNMLFKTWEHSDSENASRG